MFEDPYRFDVRRRNASEHVAFGTGVHFCLGAHLELKALTSTRSRRSAPDRAASTRSPCHFLRELLSRLDSIEPSGPPEHVVANFVGGLERLPVRYRLRTAA